MQNFAIGQEVVVLDYEDRRSGRKHYETGFFVKGRFRKNPAYSSYSRHSQEYIADATRGTHLFVQKADSVYQCGQCDGTGYVFNIPEGLDPETMTEAHRNYYRQPCNRYGCVGGQRTEPGRGKYIIDRVDKIMTKEAYQPILDAINARAVEEQLRNNARKRRIAGRVQELVDFLPTILTAENKELALAKFLDEGGRLTEMGESVRQVKEKNKPRCTHAGCTKPGETYSNGMCYEHWNEVQQAEREGEAVVA